MQHINYVCRGRKTWYILPTLSIIYLNDKHSMCWGFQDNLVSFHDNDDILQLSYTGFLVHILLFFFFYFHVLLFNHLLLDNTSVSWLGKTAKSLFYFTFFFFSFLFLSGLTTQGRSMEKYHMTCHRSGWHHMAESHDECGKVVHRPYSRYISSIQKLNKNSIEFSLSTWTRSSSKISQSKFLH